MRYVAPVGLLLLLSLVVTAALFLVAHLVVLLQALRVKKLGIWRFSALLQVPAPLIAWSGGARVWPLLWLVLGVTYLVLRTKA